MSVDIQTQPTLKVGAIRELFDAGPYDRGSLPLRNFDVTRDGQTFVFVTGGVSGMFRQINVVLDWASRVAREAPPKKS